MNRKFTDDQELVAALHDLPRAVPPRRDLWPGIAARLPARRTGGGGAAPSPARRRYALAASLAVAFATGILLGRQLEDNARPPAQPPSMDVAMLAAIKASDREYHAAFREFIPVGRARSMLGNQAVQNIENSWFELQQAESALLAALHDYPENTYLGEKLLDLRAQQLGFMQQLAMLDQTSRRKT